ncbi:Stress responsive A/B barrel domain protein [Melia azedarach]|uniref:Stress responsive A/B barrel domain protein n=1 Tax=Melia azedarach TaxID=155640 RepID=A0ACC1XDE7_MELAZ|nr:Stress responsive A/B barrel domain protein [Melia azedarach]
MMRLTLAPKARTVFSLSPTLSLTFSPPKQASLRPFKLKPRTFSVKASMSTQTTVEHIVLFKVKPDADQSKVNTMINNLSGLISLDPVRHLSVGPVLRTGSSLFTFTHMLHSRYDSKPDLNAYSQHPNHLTVVKESVLPICEDIMAVDWVADQTPNQIVIPAGSAVRVTFLKLKENLGEEVKNEVLGAIKGIKETIGGIEQITCGENFSPARAKGFSIASIAIFKGLKEMEEADSKEELVNLHKEKVKDYLESVIVVDYVVPSPSSSSL